MAQNFSIQTAHGASVADSRTIGSATYENGVWFLLHVGQIAGVANPNVPTFGGTATVSWTSLGTIVSGDSEDRFSLYRGLGDGSTGTVIVSDAGATGRISTCVAKLALAADGSSYGAGGVSGTPFVQTTMKKADNATTISQALAALIRASNPTIGAFHMFASLTWTVGAGYTALQASNTASTMTGMIEYVAPGSTTVDASTTAGRDLLMGALEFDIVEAGGDAAGVCGAGEHGLVSRGLVNGGLVN